MEVVLFLIGLAALIVANRTLRFDVDERPKGSPKREWWARAAYPKSYVHALQAFALVYVGTASAGIPVLIAVVLVFLALLIFEWTQGFIDWLDVAANAVGACLAAGLLYLGGAV